jgi:hypothetical protein
MRPDLDVGLWSSWLTHPVSLPGKKVHDDLHYSTLTEMPPTKHHCPKIEGKLVAECQHVPRMGIDSVLR